MLKMGYPEVEISSVTGCTGAILSVFEAQVALVHLGGHEIGHITLIWSRLWCFAVILGQERGRKMVRLVYLVGTSVCNSKNV